MSGRIKPEYFRIALLALLINVHAFWTRSVNSIVPDAYLDEVFHIPQAQAYWAGNWTTWDPKITTPPALYVFSSLFHGLVKPMTRSIEVTTNDLRAINFWLLYALLIALYVFDRVAAVQPPTDEVLSKEFIIVAFPLLFFFSALYYTDLFSAFAVVMTHIVWATGSKSVEGRWKWQLLHVVCGLVAIGTRQTNIFWVAVFLGGLQVRQTAARLAGKYRIFNPPMLGAYFEDFLTMCVSIGFTAISNIPALLVDLWPHLTLLASFGAFVLWNGNVVLGDKTNHIPTLHFPQMLYVWPLIVFFSWPLLLPHFFNLGTLRSKLPRWPYAVGFMSLMTLAVHYNTVVHPFTLADNRHYIFYIFRILLAHPLIKYLAVPIYFFSAWLVLQALGGTKNPRDEFSSDPEGTVRVSFVLVWLLATTLSLVSAPLVEPRYFILPWLMWRLHVPMPDVAQVTSTPAPAPAPDPKSKKPVANPKPPGRWEQLSVFVAGHVLWLELAWFVVLNLLTGWIFLFRGFEWLQEPERVQRFMW